MHGDLDDGAGLGIDVVAERTQGPGHHAVREEFSAPVMVCAVAVEGGAARQSVGQRVGCDSVSGQEPAVVAQGGLACGVARQGIEAVAGQPHNGT
ncbi:hypothetical protein [Mycobacterium colombiense]|uniref:hypothetical protein n=1 Tax=Mycobacterium colombiense TaxID=339268 RepID=UPI00308369D9